MGRDLLLQLKDLTIKYNNNVILEKFNANICGNSIYYLVSKDENKVRSILRVLNGDNLYTIVNGSLYLNGNEINNLGKSQRLEQGVFDYKSSFKYLTGNSLEEIINKNIHILKDKKMTFLSFKVNLLEYIKTLNITLDDFKKYIDREDSTSELYIKSNILLMLLLRPKVILIEGYNNAIIKKVSKLLLSDTTSIICVSNDNSLELKDKVIILD